MTDASPLPRWMGWLPIVLYLAAGAFALWAIVAPLYQLTQPAATVTVNLAAEPSGSILAQVPGLPDGVTLAPTGSDGLTVNVTATTPPCDPGSSACTAAEQGAPLWLRFLSVLPTALWSAALAVISVLLARIVTSIARNDPFASAQARRWTVIAGAIVVASLGADTLTWATASLFVNQYQLPADLVPTAYYSYIPPALALIALTLAAAFRAGRTLAEDTEGLV